MMKYELKSSTNQKINAFADELYGKVSTLYNFSHMEHHLSAPTNKPKSSKPIVLGNKNTTTECNA